MWDVYFAAHDEAVKEYASSAEREQWPKCVILHQLGDGKVLGHVNIPFELKEKDTKICWNLAQHSVSCKFADLLDIRLSAATDCELVAGPVG
jgi:hypothetical protein